MLVLKTRREIDQMREAGRVLGNAHQAVARMLAPGLSASELDAAVESILRQCGAEAVLRSVHGPNPYPAASCVCVNEQAVHAIPGVRRLQTGDLVSVDTACRLDGWCADAAWSHAVGALEDPARPRLLAAGEAVLGAGIGALRERTHWSEAASEMVRVARDAGFNVLDQFVGHGIGRELHEDPQVPVRKDLSPDRDFRLVPGLVLAIEVLLTTGQNAVRVLPDGWTVETVDGQPCVHFEHTVAITPDGPEVLTVEVGQPAACG